MSLTPSINEVNRLIKDRSKGTIAFTKPILVRSSDGMVVRAPDVPIHNDMFGNHMIGHNMYMASIPEPIEENKTKSPYKNIKLSLIDDTF